jgi:3-deoxy-D-arabino-heptulosonate 7-phosphate (DAHP) synthase class II
MTQKEEFDKAIEILDTIEENINVCCAVTMEPDEVLELVDKLRKFLNEQKDK